MLNKTVPSQKIAARTSQVVPVSFDRPYHWIERIRFGPSRCAIKAIHIAGPAGFELLADAGTGFCLSESHETEFSYLFVARQVLTVTFVNDTDEEVSTPPMLLASSVDDAPVIV